MKLTGPEQRELAKALLSAFRDRAELSRVVKFGLDEDLERIADTGDLEKVVFSIITWADARDRVEDLLRAALEENSKNAKLQEFARLRGFAIPGPDNNWRKPAGPDGPTLRATNNNLRPPIYGQLLGREDAIREVMYWLGSREPAIAIEGMPGIGKTSLAIEVAYRCQSNAGRESRHLFDLDMGLAADLDRGDVSDGLREAFRNHNKSLTTSARVEVREDQPTWTIVDRNREYVIRRESHKLIVHDRPDPVFAYGVWISARSKQKQERWLDEILNTVGEVTGFARIAQMPPEQQEAKRNEVEIILRQHAVMIIIDNYDTMDDPDLDDWILTIPEQSKVLLTTRVHPRVYGCILVDLRPLDLTASCELIRQVAERRGLANTHIPTAADEELTPLARATGGNPEAVVLALGYLRGGGLALEDVVSQLDAEKAAGNPSEVLEELLGKSWQLLSPDAQTLLMTIPTFIGVTRISKHALEAISGLAKPAFDRAQRQALDFHLVEWNLDDKTYGTHPLVRAFVTDKLESNKEFEDAARERWVTYYYEFVVANVKRPLPAERYWNALVSDKMHNIDQEWVSVRELLAWAERSGRDDLLLELTMWLVHYLDSRLRNTERLRYVQKAAAIAHEKGLFTDEALLRIDALGWTHVEENECAQAEREIAAGLEIARRLDSSSPDRADLIARGGAWQARVKIEQGDHAGASALIAEVLEIECRPMIQCRVHMAAGDIALRQGFSQQAIKHYERMVAASQTYGGEGEGYQSTPRLGLAYLASENYEKAEESFTTLYEQDDILIGKLYGVYGLANVALKQGKYERARQLLRDAEENLLPRTKSNLLLRLVQDLSSSPELRSDQGGAMGLQAEYLASRTARWLELDPSIPPRCADLLAAFQQHYGARDHGPGGAGLVLVCAPGRAEILGSHTDYNEGYTLSANVTPNLLIVARRRPDLVVQVSSLNVSAGVVRFSLGSPEDLLGQRAGRGAEDYWANYVKGVVWSFADADIPLSGFDAVLQSTVPLVGGVSSSAAVEVAVAHLLRHLAQQDIASERIVQMCKRAENLYVGAPCGYLDQGTIALADSDWLLMDYRSVDGRPFRWDRIPMDLSKEGYSLVVGYDPDSKHANVDGKYEQRQRVCKESVPVLQSLLPDQQITALRDVSAQDFETVRDAFVALQGQTATDFVTHIVNDDERVLAGAAALRRGDLRRFGEIMMASGKSALDLYALDESAPELRFVYETVVANQAGWGVAGIRNMGGGFNATTLALVPTARLSGFKRELGSIYSREQQRPYHFIEFVPAPSAGLLDIRAVYKRI